LNFYQFFELVARVTADQQDYFDVCLVGGVERLPIFSLLAVFDLNYLCEWQRGEHVEDLFGLGGCVCDDRRAE